MWLTGGIDYSKRGDRCYSDRPPGTAFLAVPPYLLGAQLGLTFPSRQWGQAALFGALLAPLLAGVVTVWLVYRLGLAMGAGNRASLGAAAVYATGSPAYIYSGTLFIHSVAGFSVTAAVLLTVFVKRHMCESGRARAPQGARPPLVLALLAGFAGGWSVLSDYSAIVLVPIYLAFVAWAGWRKRHLWSALLCWCAGAAAPAAVLGFYNWVCFGGPLVNSYRYNVAFPWTHSLSTTYVTPFGEGLMGLLYFLPEKSALGWLPTGQVFWSPVMHLAAAGYLAALARRDTRRGALLALAVLCAVIALSAKHRTWYGGGTRDARYIFSVTPIWFSGLAIWFGLAPGRKRGAALRVGFWVLTCVLIAETLALRSMWAAFGVAARLNLLSLQMPHAGAVAGGKAVGLWWEAEKWLFARWPRLLWLLAVGILVALAAMLEYRRDASAAASNEKTGPRKQGNRSRSDVRRR